jgi:WD40 repeat protein
MSGGKLEFVHAFGSSSHTEIKDSLFFGDDDLSCVIYPVGRHIALRNPETAEMTLIKQPDRVTKITAMALTPEKTRRFLAVAEQIGAEHVCQISIFDLKKGQNFKRMRTTVFTELRSMSVKSLAFSYDSRFLAIMGEEPGYCAILWDWLKEKVLGDCRMETPISRITVSPKDGHLLATTGLNHWKVWRVQENSFKQQPMISGVSQTQNFTDHAWTFDNMIVCTNDMGEAFVSRDYEIIMYIPNSFGRVSDVVF